MISRKANSFILSKYGQKLLIGKKKIPRENVKISINENTMKFFIKKKWKSKNFPSFNDCIMRCVILLLNCLKSFFFYFNLLYPFRFLRDRFYSDSLALIGRYFQSERKSFKKFSHRFSVSKRQVSKRSPIKRLGNLSTENQLSHAYLYTNKGVF